MVILGLGLMIVGAAAILFAFVATDPGTGGAYLGFAVDTLQAFLIGVAAGAALLWGFAILKWGTKRELAHRRERKELTRLNEKLDQVESDRKKEDGEPV